MHLKYTLTGYLSPHCESGQDQERGSTFCSVLFESVAGEHKLACRREQQTWAWNTASCLSDVALDAKRLVQTSVSLA